MAINFDNPALGPSYVNEDPVPETRDMTITDAAFVDGGLRMVFNGQDVGQYVVRISAADPLPDTPVFYLDDMGPTPDWVYGPDGRWTRTWPLGSEPRTWYQRIGDWWFDLLDTIEDGMVTLIWRIRDAVAIRRPGDWQPARPDDHQGLMHGFHQTFDHSDVVIPSARLDRIEGVITYVHHPRPDFDSYYNQQDLDLHGLDGGVPMSLEDLIGAEEKMDAIDRLLDE